MTTAKLCVDCITSKKPVDVWIHYWWKQAFCLNLIWWTPLCVLLPPRVNKEFVQLRPCWTYPMVMVTINVHANLIATPTTLRWETQDTFSIFGNNVTYIFSVCYIWNHMAFWSKLGHISWGVQDIFLWPASDLQRATKSWTIRKL